MARVNLFDFTGSISNESVTHDNAESVALNAKNDLPKQVQEDADAVHVDKDVSAEASNTKTSEPGPKDGGGDGTADFQAADKSKVDIDIADVDPKIAHVQTGGKDIDKLPNQVKAKDGLSASDISTSVEEHTDKAESESEESELESIDASGAEVVGAADDMIQDLDSEELEVAGLTDAADKGISEADAAFAKVDELNKGVASVERYLGLLNRLDETGRAMSPELRQSISWALEAIDSELFFDERVALESFDPSARVSLEASDMVVAGARQSHGEIDDGDDPGSVAKGISGKLKQLIDAGIRMFWRAVNAVVDAYHALTSNMPKIRDHLSELRAKAKILDGGKEFQMKGAHRLLIGDEFVGDSRQAIDKVSKTANELLLAWPNQLGKLIKEWQDGRTGLFGAFLGKSDQGNYSKLIDGVGDLMDRSFRGMQSLNPSDRDKVPSGFLNATRVHWSGPLPGNRALYTGVNDKGNHVEQSMINQSVMINFSAIPGEDTSSEAVSVATPSGGEAIAIIRELEKLTHFIDDAKKGMAEIKKMGEEAFGESVQDLLGMGGANESKMMAGIMMMGLASATTQSQSQFFGYLTGMIKSYIGFISASLKAEGGSQDDIEGSATRVA